MQFLLEKEVKKKKKYFTRLWKRQSVQKLCCTEHLWFVYRMWNRYNFKADSSLVNKIWVAGVTK